MSIAHLRLKQRESAMITAEAAKRLGITKRSVSGLCNLGTITARKLGRDWWIEEEEVERYARDRRPRREPSKEVHDEGGEE
jgi:excisionase family DNA binding protein